MPEVSLSFDITADNVEEKMRDAIAVKFFWDYYTMFIDDAIEDKESSSNELSLTMLQLAELAYCMADTFLSARNRSHGDPKDES